MTTTSEPVVATFYIFRHQGHVVAVALGQASPDPGCSWDAITRVPIVTNGHRPNWRAFTAKQGESMKRAIQRRRWPQEEAS